jgi:hypothetical protein
MLTKRHNSLIASTISTLLQVCSEEQVRFKIFAPNSNPGLFELPPTSFSLPGMRQHEGERILQIVRPGVPLSLLMKPAPNPPSSHDLHHGGNLEEFVSDPVALLACTTQKLLANSTSPKSHSGTQHNLPYTTDVHREAPHPI